MASNTFTLLSLCLSLLGVKASGTVHNAVETEMFAIPISPNLFNWTYQEFDQQYRFHASLLNKPELPSWLRYIYSGRHHSGFIFGTPPRNTQSPITIEVIGLNRLDYETRRLLLTLNIRPKEKMALHEVELKIDNLNVEDLLDEHRMSRLKDIFRGKLWSESSDDLHATFLASAVALGARLPLKPNDGEGLVIRLGSAAPFSAELKRLREEVRPLSRLPSCPRDYKRTTVERLYRDIGMALDWCHFELYNTIYTDRSTQLLEYLSEIPSPDNKDTFTPSDRTPWHAPRRSSTPSRRGVSQLAKAAAAPALLLLIALTALAAVICARNYPVEDSDSNRFLDTIFHLFTDRRNKRANKTPNLDVCHYETNNTEQTQVADNGSVKSAGVSPNNSLARPYSPKSSTNLAGSYNRPQPPPYLSTTNSLSRNKQNSLTPEHRNMALEESLKLLNEAKIDDGGLMMMEPKSILKEPVIDITDGMDDYVPIPDATAYGSLQPDATGFGSVKPDTTGYASVKPDLDDIVVPELSKYGLGSVAI